MEEDAEGRAVGVGEFGLVAEIGGGRLALEPGPGERGLRVVFDLPCAQPGG